MKSLIVPGNLQFATVVYIKKTHIIDHKIVIKNRLERVRHYMLKLLRRFTRGNIVYHCYIFSRLNKELRTDGDMW